MYIYSSISMIVHFIKPFGKTLHDQHMSARERTLMNALQIESAIRITMKYTQFAAHTQSGGDTRTARQGTHAQKHLRQTDLHAIARDQDKIKALPFLCAIGPAL